MRQDMEEYEKDPSKYTQSLGCWHGFIAQQAMISVKKHFGTTKRKYLYLSGWMVAAMRSDFGPLPDQVIKSTYHTYLITKSTNIFSILKFC